MPVYTLVHAVLLVTLGVGGFVATGSEHRTALIPAAIGGAFAVCGALALAKPGALKHAMHAAAMLALVTVIATGKGVWSTVQVLQGVELPTPPAAAYAKATAAVLNAVFLALCVKSFRDARIRRQQAQGAAGPT